jgi:hypothetical protein
MKIRFGGNILLASIHYIKQNLNDKFDILKKGSVPYVYIYVKLCQ